MKRILWAAKECGGCTVWLFTDKPVEGDSGCFVSSAESIVGCVDEDVIPFVTYENSPMEIECEFNM